MQGFGAAAVRNVLLFQGSGAPHPGPSSLAVSQLTKPIYNHRICWLIGSSSSSEENVPTLQGEKLRPELVCEQDLLAQHCTPPHYPQPPKAGHLTCECDSQGRGPTLPAVPSGCMTHLLPRDSHFSGAPPTVNKKAGDLVAATPQLFSPPCSLQGEILHLFLMGVGGPAISPESHGGKLHGQSERQVPRCLACSLLACLCRGPLSQE